MYFSISYFVIVPFLSAVLSIPLKPALLNEDFKFYKTSLNFYYLTELMSSRILT